MNPRDLPIVGPITNTDKDYIGNFTDISGRSVLCIGYSEAEIDQFVRKYRPESISVLTNWVGHEDAKIKKYPLVIGDITKKTGFPDDHFDAILTLSVLEHLSDLESSAKEMTRIVKKGGELLHLFGPAWSCAYGHHIYARPGDRLLDFTCWAIPAHIHLLCDSQEIARYYLDSGYSEDEVLSVMEWFYKTPIINRAFYDTYTRLFAEHFQIDKMEMMYNYLPADHVKRLRSKFPGNLDFSTYGGKYKLIVCK